nr:histidine kinase dimerization/phosphoacceptor domain -containing protein [Rhodohalobacter sp. SW132]
MFTIDPKLYKILSINDEVQHLLGYSTNDLSGEPLTKLIHGSEFINELNRWADSNDRPDHFSRQTLIKSANENCFWFEVTLSEKKGLWYATAKSIQKMKEIEMSHQDTLNILTQAQRIAMVGHWVWLPQQDILTWSPQLHQLMRTDPDTFEPSIERFEEMLPGEEDVQKLTDAVTRVIGGGEFIPCEHKVTRADGEQIHVIERAEVYRNEEGAPVKVMGILKDITQQKESQMKISESLHEKELMLGEIHHRVKNNLAMISGIIQLEMSSSEPDSESIQSILTRIQSLALVHENLYQSDSFSKVPFGSLLEDLISIAAKNASGDHAPEITIESVPVDININQAIPFALAINQLIYACLGRDPNPITISLDEVDEQVRLQIYKTGDACSILKYDITSSNDELSRELFHSLLKQCGADYKIDLDDFNIKLVLSFIKSNIKGSSDSQLFMN